MIKKFSSDEIRVRIENLKKILGWVEVEMTIAKFKSYSYNDCDVLHLAYYDLKKKHLKFNREAFGKLNEVEYEQIKPQHTWDYDWGRNYNYNYCGNYDWTCNYDSSSLTTATNTITTSAYLYNLFDGYTTYNLLNNGN